MIVHAVFFHFTTQHVVRTLFALEDGPHMRHLSQADPAILGPSSGIAAKIRLEHSLFSPIQASPLLSCHQKQQPARPDSEADCDMTAFLISSQSVQETPTSRRTSERESVVLDRAFCEDETQQVTCSQELFESPEVIDGRKVEVIADPIPAVVNSIPDSPGPSTDHADLHSVSIQDGNVGIIDHTLRDCMAGGSCTALPVQETVEEEEGVPESTGSAGTGAGLIIAPQTGMSEPHISLTVIEKEVQTRKQTASSSQSLAKRSAPATTDLLLECTNPSFKQRRVTSTIFLYPGSKQLAKKMRQIKRTRKDLSEVKEVEFSVMESPGLPCQTSSRKRPASHALASSGKKPHINPQAIEALGDGGLLGTPRAHSESAPVNTVSSSDPNGTTCLTGGLSSETAADIVTSVAQSPPTILPSDLRSVEKSTENNSRNLESFQPSTVLHQASDQTSSGSTDQKALSSDDRSIHDSIKMKGVVENVLGLNKASLERKGILSDAEHPPTDQPPISIAKRTADQQNIVDTLPLPVSLPQSPPSLPSTAPLLASTPLPAPTTTTLPSAPPPPPLLPTSAGFKTASGCSIHISTKGIERAKELMRSEDSHQRQHKCSDTKLKDSSSSTLAVSRKPFLLSSFPGFQTASGHSISVSDKGVDRARRLLSEDDDKEADPSASVSLHTLPGGARSLEERADASKTTIRLSPVQLLTHNSEGKVTPVHPPAHESEGQITSRTPSVDTPLPTPCSTAVTQSRAHRGKKPFRAPRLASTVSREEEEANISRLLKNMRRAGAGCDSETPSIGRGGEGGGSKSTAVTSGTDDMHISCGFSTAGGKSLTVSASSFRQAQQMVAEEGREDEIVQSPAALPLKNSDLITPIFSPVFCGFQSASGKGLQVSTKALERAESIFSDIAGENKLLNAPPYTSHDMHSSLSEDPGRELISTDAQHCQGCSFTADDLDSEGIDQFTTFTQVQFGQTEGERPAKTSTDTENMDDFVACDSPTSTVGDSKTLEKIKLRRTQEEDEGEENGEDDHSMYFSTQVVKHFLDISNDEENMSEAGTMRGTHAPEEEVEEEEEEEMDEEVVVEKKEKEPMSQAEVPIQASQVSLKDREEKGSEREEKKREVEGEEDDAYPEVSDSKAVAEDEDISSFCCQTTSQSIIDELFGSMEYDTAEIDAPTSNAAPTSTTLTGTPKATAADVSNSAPSQHVEAAVDGTVAIAGCPELSEMSVSMVESLCTMMDMPATAQDGESEYVGSQRVAQEEEVMEEEEVMKMEEDDKDGKKEEEADERKGEEAQGAVSTGAYKDMVQKGASVHSIPFPGLMTAGGKSVSLSKTALMAAKSLLHTPPLSSFSSLQDPVLFPNSSSHVVSPAVSPGISARGRPAVGLQTASGKPVQVSEDALRAVKSTLASPPPPHPSLPQPSPLPIYPGLQTASHKPVAVSSQALAQVKALLHNPSVKLPPSSAPPPTFLQSSSQDFPSISPKLHKTLTVSVDPSRALGLPTAAASDASHGRMVGTLLHLQTAGGRRVEVSQEALSAAREATGGGLGGPRHVLAGFHTAAGNTVEISQSTLEAVKRNSTPLSTKYRLHPDLHDSSSSTSSAAEISGGTPTPPVTSAGTSHPVPPTASVRYRPVFRRGHQASSLPPSLSLPPPPPSQPTPSLVNPMDRQPHGLFSSVEGI